MKTWLVLLFVASATLVATAADAPTLNGRWQVHASVAGTESDSVCTFSQQETVLTGTCATDAGSFDANGKVDNKKVSWSYKTLYNGSPLLVEYEGTWDLAGTMTGTVNVPDYAVSGEFSATQAK